MREFVRILKLHSHYPVDLVAQAIGQALEYSCAHADGVELCLRQLLNPGSSVSAIDLTQWPQLATVGTPVPDLRCYDQLLERV